MPPKQVKKPEPLEYNSQGQVRNPKTQRWVKKTGEVGKKVLADYTKKMKAFEKHQATATPVQKLKHTLKEIEKGIESELESPLDYLERTFKSKRKASSKTQSKKQTKTHTTRSGQENARRRKLLIKDLPDDFESGGSGYSKGKGDGSEFF